MKAYGEVDVWIHVKLTLALVRGEWSTPRPCGRRGENGSCTHWIGGFMDPKVVLDDIIIIIIIII
jgi:hypothetical protein